MIAYRINYKKEACCCFRKLIVIISATNYTITHFTRETWASLFYRSIKYCSSSSAWYVYAIIRLYSSLMLCWQIAGVLAFVGFFTFSSGYPFSVIVQVLILVFAILGCIGAWLAHRILLFFTAIGFVSSGSEKKSFRFCLVNTNG